MAWSHDNTLPPPGEARYIGAPVPRVEDDRLLRGEGRFTASVRRPNMLSACFARASEAHGRIVHVDTAAAATAPGVVAVYTARDFDIPPLAHGISFDDLKDAPQPVLADGKVRFTGEAVALIIAEDRYLAEDAAELVRVELDSLPPIASVSASLAPGAQRVHESVEGNVLFDRVVSTGDVDGAFASADRVFATTVDLNRYVACPLEPRALVAEYRAGSGELTIWATTQVPHGLLSTVARHLGLPTHKCRVLAQDVGGGFGQKGAASPEDIAVAAAAHRLGRAVSWVEDRRENLLAATHAKQQTVTIEAALTHDGVLIGMRAEMVADVGAYSRNYMSVLVEPLIGIHALPGPYRLEHLRWRAVAALTNKAPTGSYRGVGTTAACAARDVFFGQVARELGLDPADFIRRNLIASDQLPYTTATGLVYDSGDYVATFDASLEAAGYEQLRERQRTLRGAGRHIGIGVSPYVEATGWGSKLAAQAGFNFPGNDNATVSMDAAGKVTVATSLSSQGQGHETSFAQVVADVLGVAIEDVTVVQSDTAATPLGMGTFASRSAVVGTGAVTLAATDVRDKILRLAATILEADPGDVTVANGSAAVAGVPDRRVGVAEIARRAFYDLSLRDEHETHALRATRFYDPGGTYSNGCFVVVAEVDPELGIVRVERIVGAEDCGRVLNPKIVEGQSHGAAAQAIGGALLEDLRYDEQAVPVTTTFLDYLLPTAMDVPDVEIVHLETPSDMVGGVKGVGEGGMQAVPGALMCAVQDALSPCGARVSQLPLTPERVRELALGLVEASAS